MSRFLDSRITRWSLLFWPSRSLRSEIFRGSWTTYDQAKQAFTSFRNGRARALVLPAHAELVGRDQAAAGRLDFRWNFRGHSLVGTGVAAAVISRGDGLLALVVRAASVYGSVAALAAGCAFSFNLFALRLASLVRTDMPLALVIFAHRLADLEKIRTRTAWTKRDRVVLFLLLLALRC